MGGFGRFPSTVVGGFGSRFVSSVGPVGHLGTRPTATLLATRCHHIQSAVWPFWSPSEKTLLRSQGDLLVGIPFTCFPTSPQSRFDSSLLHVLILRRVWQSLLSVWPSSRRANGDEFDAACTGATTERRATHRYPKPHRFTECVRQVRLTTHEQ